MSEEETQFSFIIYYYFQLLRRMAVDKQVCNTFWNKKPIFCSLFLRVTDVCMYVHTGKERVQLDGVDSHFSPLHGLQGPGSGHQVLWHVLYPLNYLPNLTY